MCFGFYYTWLDISLFLVFLAHPTQRVMQAFTIIWRSLPSVVLGFKKKILNHPEGICFQNYVRSSQSSKMSMVTINVT